MNTFACKILSNSLAKLLNRLFNKRLAKDRFMILDQQLNENKNGLSVVYHQYHSASTYSSQDI